MSFLIQFLPFIFIALVANFGERYPAARPLVYILHLLLNSLVAMMGALFIVLGYLSPKMASAPTGLTSPQAAVSLGALLITCAVLATTPLFSAVRRLLAHFLPINPHSLMDMTALVFATYLGGISLGQALIFGTEVFEVDLGVGWLTPEAIVVSGGAFLILAVVGVGWGIRRGWRDAVERLGIGTLTWRQVALCAGFVVLLLVLDHTTSEVWALIDPQGHAQIMDLTDRLFGPFANPAGALLIGITAGVGEETLFRGALQPRLGLPLTSLLFALAHVQYGLSPATLEIFILAIVLGWVRRRMNTSACILIHFAFNTIGLLLPT
ncbi:MAG: CPBP family intramembrane metalloprotease [Chloroflexi bacterium]|nr:CPBP family intramembrane metalloprotease [Chloroflexota bacterium]